MRTSHKYPWIAATFLGVVGFATLINHRSSVKLDPTETPAKTAPATREPRERHLQQNELEPRADLTGKQRDNLRDALATYYLFALENRRNGSIGIPR